MPLYQNGYKRPLTYKVTYTNELGDVETTIYSVLIAFSFYNSITVDEYLSMPEALAKQRMDDFIIYINNNFYDGETPTIDQSEYNIFDIYDTETCEITIPEDILPPTVEKQDVCLSSEMINITDDQVVIRWGANIYEGLALQEIQVPIRIIKGGSTVLSEEIIVISINESMGYVDIAYNREETDYNLLSAFNIAGNDPQFNIGTQCAVTYPEETVPAITTINTLFIHIPTL